MKSEIVHLIANTEKPRVFDGKGKRRICTQAPQSAVVWIVKQEGNGPKDFVAVYFLN